MALGELFSVSMALLFVIGLILAAFWLLRRAPWLGRLGTMGERNLKILSSQQIAGRAWLIEVEWHQEQLLILAPQGGGASLISKRKPNAASFDQALAQNEQALAESEQALSEQTLAEIAKATKASKSIASKAKASKTSKSRASKSKTSKAKAGKAKRVRGA